MVSRKDILFKYLQNSNFNFRSPTLVINVSWENKFLTSRSKTVRHQYLPYQFYLVFLFDSIARTYILFTHMKKVKLVLNRNHSLWRATRQGKFVFWQQVWVTCRLVLATTRKLLFPYHISWTNQTTRKMYFRQQFMDPCRRRTTTYSLLRDEVPQSVTACTRMT